MCFSWMFGEGIPIIFSGILPEVLARFGCAVASMVALRHADTP